MGVAYRGSILARRINAPSARLACGIQAFLKRRRVVGLAISGCREIADGQAIRARGKRMGRHSKQDGRASERHTDLHI